MLVLERSPILILTVGPLTLAFIVGRCQALHLRVLERFPILILTVGLLKPACVCEVLRGATCIRPRTLPYADSDGWVAWTDVYCEAFSGATCARP